jgi:hypothetical protein
LIYERDKKRFKEKLQKVLYFKNKVRDLQPPYESGQLKKYKGSYKDKI